MEQMSQLSLVEIALCTIQQRPKLVQRLSADERKALARSAAGAARHGAIEAMAAFIQSYEQQTGN
jgi:hypothetical protein